jgi:hypothetical protein
VIVVWLAGGPSTLDIWDPKEGRENGGPTKAIETSVKGIQYADNMPTVAKVAEHVAVVRSMVSREGSHERGRYLLHTGYIPTGTVVHPSMGSITALEMGNKKLDLPNFISLGGSTDGAGFLPPEYNPFVVDAGGARGGGAAPTSRAAPRRATRSRSATSTIRRASTRPASASGCGSSRSRRPTSRRSTPRRRSRSTRPPTRRPTG